MSSLYSSLSGSPPTLATPSWLRGFFIKCVEPIPHAYFLGDFGASIIRKGIRSFRSAWIPPRLHLIPWLSAQHRPVIHPGWTPHTSWMDPPCPNPPSDRTWIVSTTWHVSTPDRLRFLKHFGVCFKPDSSRFQRNLPSQIQRIFKTSYMIFISWLRVIF